MNSIMNYIVDMVPIMILFLPVFIIGRFIIYKVIFRIKVNWNHEVGLLILFLFSIGLISQALTGNFSITNIDLHKINFIPFKILIETFQEMFVENNFHYFVISFLGNIVMFIPIGFLVSILFKIKDFVVISIVFSFSLFIEINQLFLVRSTDIDDLILNTFGGFLGLLLYKLLYRKYKNKLDKYKLIRI